MDCSRIYLKRRRDGELIEAELWDEITDEHLRLWEEKWVPQMVAVVQRNIRESLPRHKWPQDLHWNWRAKVVPRRGLIGFNGFAILCDSELQGLMLLNLTKRARIREQEGKEYCLCGNIISTAPWNRDQITPKPIYGGVGPVSVFAANKAERSPGVSRTNRTAFDSCRRPTSFTRKDAA